MKKFAFLSLLLLSSLIFSACSRQNNKVVPPSENNSPTPTKIAIPASVDTDLPPVPDSDKDLLNDLNNLDEINLDSDLNQIEDNLN